MGIIRTFSRPNFFAPAAVIDVGSGGGGGSSERVVGDGPPVLDCLTPNHFMAMLSVVSLGFRVAAERVVMGVCRRGSLWGGEGRR
jgi:hypothetical protein